MSLTTFPLFGQEAKSKGKATAPIAAPAPKVDYNAVDWGTIARIRNEAFRNSKVMEILSDITDGIGPRLTNSPNMRKANAWTRDQLTKFGLENSHLEAWGPFGRGWSYETSTVQMTSPDRSELIALPKAWTPGTNGPVRGKVMRFRATTSEELAKYKGKITGAILLTGDMRDLVLNTKALSERYDEKTLAEEAEYEIPGSRPPSPALAAFLNVTPEERQRRQRFARELVKFLDEEKPAVVIEGSRSPGEGGTVFVQGNGQAFRKGELTGPPALVMNIEHYGRISRLLDKKVDVELEVNVKTTFYDDDPMGYNTVAEIPGTDPALKDQVVMLGGHLDSWHGGTGATDNAAGSAVAMEAVRIIKALGLKPRRTIRIALWSGEEQGLMGSRGYVAEHLASRPENTDAAVQNMPAFLRPPAGPLSFKPEWDKVSAYFNIDNGSGKIRGIYMQENAAVAPIFKAWMEPFADLGMSAMSMRNTGGTDHLSFDAVGVPGFQFIQDGLEYDTRTHHSNMDVYERLQKGDLMQMAAIEASFVYMAAMRDDMFPRKPVPPDPPRPGQPAAAAPAAAAPAAEPKKDEKKPAAKKDDKKPAEPKKP
ncbi:MAG TPA: M20/M25/M40 family metallo-hydrolase [Terriglobales bacterium]|nr:M20/M25/M40 family metallo-hydrolase [Terriglobales bacterium]